MDRRYGLHMSKFLLIGVMILAACAPATPAPQPVTGDTPAAAAARADLVKQGAAAANDHSAFPNLADVPDRPVRPTSPEEGEKLIEQMQQDAASARVSP